MHRISNLTHTLALLSIMIVQLAGAEVPLQQVYVSSHPAWINCISEDQYSQVSGFLLVCEGHQLISFNYGQYDNPAADSNVLKQSIVGARNYGYGEGVGVNALFRLITDVAHLDSNTEVVIDQQNQCLRTVDRTLNRTSTFAGGCTTAGTADGSFNDARFNTPYRMSKLGDYLYVTGWANSVIRVLDLIKRQVSTLSLAGSVENPSGIAIKANEPLAILITVEHGIAEYNTDTGKIVLLAGAESAADSVNQSLQSAFDSPRDIVVEASNRFLIADRDNGKVKRLDIDQNWITLVTSSTPKVTVIYLLNGVAFLGCQNDSIGYIYTFDLPSSLTSTPTTSTPTTNTLTNSKPTASTPTTSTLTTNTLTTSMPITGMPTASATTTISSAHNQQPALQIAAIVRVLVCSVQLLLLVLI